MFVRPSGLGRHVGLGLDTGDPTSDGTPANAWIVGPDETTVSDSNGAFVGYMQSDGTVRDGSNNILGTDNGNGTIDAGSLGNVPLLITAPAVSVSQSQAPAGTIGTAGKAPGNTTPGAPAGSSITSWLDSYLYKKPSTGGFPMNITVGGVLLGTGLLAALSAVTAKAKAGRGRR